MLKIDSIFVCVCFALGGTVGFSHGDEVYKNKKRLESEKYESSDEKVQPRDIPSKSLALINNSYQSILPIFRRACFDCHSNETEYPWYSKLPFVSHLIERDITDAKEHLVMGTSFPFAGHGTPFGDLKAIEKSIKEGDMPPFRYQIMHWEAFLNEKEKAKIFEWITSAKQTIKK